MPAWLAHVGGPNGVGVIAGVLKGIQSGVQRGDLPLGESELVFQVGSSMTNLLRLHG